jgi:hypothetical protein
LELWEIRQQVEWAKAHPQPPFDPDNVELVDINELVTLQGVMVERDGAGRITRVIGGDQ